MNQDFIAKLTLDEAAEEREVETEESEPASLNEEVEVEEEEEEEGDDEEEDFSFVCVNTDGSPISAEEIFQNGQIRPIFPMFNRALLFEDAGVSSSSASGPVLRPPLKKLFVEDRPSSSSSSDADELEAVEPGTYCEWSGEKSAEASPEMRKKSNSTGFSRLWRFRDLAIRSSSDGKDAFVFLNPNSVAATAAKSKQPEASKATAPPAAAIPVKADKVSAAIAAAATAAKAPAKKKKPRETASSAHEKHYMRNRAKKEVDKRRSYLPYRPDLVGFFTSVNGLSRNVHPF